MKKFNFKDLLCLSIIGLVFFSCETTQKLVYVNAIEKSVSIDVGMSKNQVIEIVGVPPAKRDVQENVEALQWQSYMFNPKTGKREYDFERSEPLLVWFQNGYVTKVATGNFWGFFRIEWNTPDYTKEIRVR
jgi:hypothetical protein